MKSCIVHFPFTTSKKIVNCVVHKSRQENVSPNTVLNNILENYFCNYADDICVNIKNVKASIEDEMTRKSIGEKIAYMRQSLGLSQYELGEAINMHQRVLSKIERGVRKIYVLEAVKLCKIFEIKIEDLLEGG